MTSSAHPASARQSHAQPTTARAEIKSGVEKTTGSTPAVGESGWRMTDGDDGGRVLAMGAVGKRSRMAACTETEAAPPEGGRACVAEWVNATLPIPSSDFVGQWRSIPCSIFRDMSFTTIITFYLLSPPLSTYIIQPLLLPVLLLSKAAKIAKPCLPRPPPCRLFPAICCLPCVCFPAIF